MDQRWPQALDVANEASAGRNGTKKSIDYGLRVFGCLDCERRRVGFLVHLECQNRTTHRSWRIGFPHMLHGPSGVPKP
jgi:hypothetical protein